MFCTNCGNEVKTGKFCKNCGAQIEEEKVIEEVNNEVKVIEEVSKQPVITEIKAEPTEIVDSNVDNTPITIVEETKSSNDDSSSNQSYKVEQEYSSKSKIAAGLLGIFLGAFGVHNFYLGYTGKAVAQLLITILSCGILAVVSIVWGLVEGIMILATNDYKDGQGKILKD